MYKCPWNIKDHLKHSYENHVWDAEESMKYLKFLETKLWEHSTSILLISRCSCFWNSKNSLTVNFFEPSEPKK